MENQHTHVFWFRYVDDTFIIWPHGKEKLTEFLNYLSGLHTNMQVTMEQEEGHLPFSDFEIYRKISCVTVQVIRNLFGFTTT
jgi:hypothetical protein